MSSRLPGNKMTNSTTRSIRAAIPLSVAVCAAALWSGCAPTGPDASAGSGGRTSIATGGAGVIATGGATGGQLGSGGSQGTGGEYAASGGSPGSTGGTPGSGGNGGQATGSGGSGGAANPDAGMAGGGRDGLGGTGSGGLGGTTTGTGGAGAASAYNPCPANGTCKILPFGDSITKGEKSSDAAGYRSPLYKLIVAAKQKVTFTGSRADGPSQVSGQAFPRSHEGHPGWTIDPGFNMISSSYSGISTLVPSPALNGSPNIILLMIGTNDLFARETANMAARLEVLLDKIVQNAPNALIVLAQITPLERTSAALTAYNAKIPGIVQARAAKGQHIIGVDMSKLPINQLSDGTHPNDQGYAYMANIWYAAIKDLLPQ